MVPLERDAAVAVPELSLLPEQPRRQLEHPRAAARVAGARSRAIGLAASMVCPVAAKRDSRAYGRLVTMRARRPAPLRHRTRPSADSLGRYLHADRLMFWVTCYGCLRRSSLVPEPSIWSLSCAQRRTGEAVAAASARSMFSRKSVSSATA